VTLNTATALPLCGYVVVVLKETIIITMLG
jgi:hypothetical protein